MDVVNAAARAALKAGVPKEHVQAIAEGVIAAAARQLAPRKTAEDGRYKEWEGSRAPRDAEARRGQQGDARARPQRADVAGMQRGSACNRRARLGA
jgi:hypothetical protein